MARAIKPCGTDAGYHRHRRHGERPCVRCFNAHADYYRAYRAKSLTVQNKSSATTVAWNAATKRLRLRYNDLFHRYYAEELAKVGQRARGS